MYENMTSSRAMHLNKVDRRSFLLARQIKTAKPITKTSTGIPCESRTSVQATVDKVATQIRFVVISVATRSQHVRAMIANDMPSDSLSTSRFHNPNLGWIAMAAIAAHVSHASGRTFMMRKIVWHKKATETAKRSVCNKTNARVLQALIHKRNGTPTGRSVNQNDGLNGPIFATLRYEAESGKKDGKPFLHPGPTTRTT